MRESPEAIAAFNKASDQRLSRIINAMLAFRLFFGDAVDFLNNEDAFEKVEECDIVELTPVDEPL